ncbi:MAG: DUF885 family protein [Erysipelotrichaceae bacterium]|nr:DUF885 family protein [Erysipelotrichaceae bacterium]
MKRIIALIMVLLVTLSGCASEKKNEWSSDKIDNNAVNRVVNGNDLTGKDYIDLLKNYIVRVKDQSRTEDNEEFDKFLDEIFIEGMEADYLTMHYNVIDYKSYGITKPELTVGELEYSNDPDISELVDQMERLQKFDFDSLSYRQQYDYECLEYSLLESMAATCYEKYDQLFTGGTDILSNLVTNFDGFIFYDKEMVDDYMVLLADLDRYIDDALEYTARQAEDGLYLTDYSIDYQLDYVDGFVSKTDDNVLITSFDERIEKADFLSADEKEVYRKENARIVKEEIIPAYEKVGNELEQYYGKATVDTNRLSNIDKDYAELVYMLNSSINSSAEDIFNDARERLDDYIALFNTALNDQKNIQGYYALFDGSIKPLGSSNEEILEFLAANYTQNYPDVGELNYRISYLDESSASDSILAYYLSSPIDDIEQNVIRVNPNNTSSDPLSDYITIAHEGIPGHLYDHVHYFKSEPHYFRTTQSFLGYTEGYACNAEINALDYLGISEGVKDIAFLQEFGGYLLLSITDMGVNCFGWTEEDVAEFMDESGFNGAYAADLMEDVVDRVGVLCRYGIGYLNFRQLHDYASEKLGDRFDEVRFNEACLKNGALPFNILKEEINEYIYE